MKKTVWTFGLISGAIMSALMLLTIPYVDEIGYDKGIVVGYTTMVLAFMLVYFGVRSYRDNVAGGEIGFGRALAVGSLIALIASACYVAMWELVYFQIAPEYGDAIQAAMIEKARASGGSAEAVRQQIEEIQRFAVRYRNPLFNAAVTFLEPLPVGIIFSLVTAGILGRRRGQAAGGAAASVVSNGALVR